MDSWESLRFPGIPGILEALLSKWEFQATTDKLSYILYVGRCVHLRNWSHNSWMLRIPTDIRQKTEKRLPVASPSSVLISYYGLVYRGVGNGKRTHRAANGHRLESNPTTTTSYNIHLSLSPPIYPTFTLALAPYYLLIPPGPSGPTKMFPYK